MAQSVKLKTTETFAPPSGWQPVGLRVRALTGLDGATGRLTGDQQRAYADLPKAPMPESYAPHHVAARYADQGVEYHALTRVPGGMGNYPRASITVEGGLRA